MNNWKKLFWLEVILAIGTLATFAGCFGILTHGLMGSDQLSGPRFVAGIGAFLAYTAWYFKRKCRSQVVLDKAG